MTSTDTLARITAFLEDIGIPVHVETLGDDTLMPGVTIRDGAVVYDPTIPYPGDLLHEAGHIAVTPPERRPTLGKVPKNAGEELAAIAWSYAAARAAGVDPEIVFHAGGYRGGGGYLIPAMQTDVPPGAPLLHCWDMTTLSSGDAEPGQAVFPQMARWLR